MGAHGFLAIRLDVRGPRGEVEVCGKKSEHGLVDVQFQGASGEYVGSYVEFPEVTGRVIWWGEEERGVDVWLSDKVAELGSYDSVVFVFFCL